MTLRAGLIGVGAMGANHLRVLDSLDGVELVAAVDPDPAAGVRLREGQAADSLEQALERGLDYAVLAVPTKLHAQLAFQLADAGVHALIEKPVAPDARTARAMADRFRAAGLVGAVGHVERYNPALQAMRERLEAGALGDVYQVATRRQGPFPPRIADVGVVLDLATHDFDLTTWVTDSQYLSVEALTAHKAGREHEDLLAAIGLLDGGVIASHLVNWLSPMKERITIVTGERGAFIANTLTGDLTLHENGVVDSEWNAVAHFRGVTEGNMTRFAIRKFEPLRLEHEAFRDAVLGLSDQCISIAEAGETIAVVEAALASARAERPRLASRR